MVVFADLYLWLTDHPGVLIAGFCLYVFVFVLSVLFSGPKPGPNPFKSNTSRPPKPLVIDQNVRDKVLKQAFLPKKVPEKLDAIVIGSGIGGLSVAAILSRAGKKVLVLEQHDQAGGCCHSFIDKGFEFDVGIHYIGEMRQNTMSRLLVDQITDGQLQWTDLDKEFDVVAIGEPGKQKFYPYECGSKEIWKAAILKKFPDEEKAIDKYLEYLQAVRRSMLGKISLKFMSKSAARILINTGLVHRMTKFFKFANRTLEDVLNEITDNAELKAVLAYSFGDYGVAPKHSSFAMHALLINHYMYGASYPKGGASEIAFHTIPVIEKSGGRVLVRAHVTQILFDGKGKAVGVRVNKPGGSVDIYAPVVISDAGAINTFKSLVPEEHAHKSGIYKLIKEKKVEAGVGCMSLFVGLKGTTEELGVKGQNIWAFTGNDLSRLVEDYINLDAASATESEVPLLFISFPSAKDPTYNDRFPGKSACTVITLANWKWFEQWKNEQVKKRGPEYEAIKEAIGRRMWEQVLAIYPHLEDKVEYFSVGTPVSNQYYLGSSEGEIYGLDHTKERFGSPEIVMNLRPDTDIPGLLLTGQDVISCGFMGAMFGGLLCASQILHRNIWDDLSALKKNMKKAE